MMPPALPSLALSLRTEVERFCLPDGRMVGTPGHEVAERYLLDRIDAIGLEPYAGAFEHGYKRRRTRFTNILPVLAGRDRSLPPIVLGAHYDSVIAAPCADDNGAAVAIALALAERIRPQELERDLVFGFFDAEEPPHYLTPSMGSIRFYAEQMDERGVHAAVVLDLVGHDVPIDLLGPPLSMLPGVARLRRLLAITGAESHPDLEAVLRGTPCPDDLHPVATLNCYVGDMSDHSVFRWNEEPFLFFSCGRWQHYHQPTDTPDRLNYDKMARTTVYLQALLARLAATPLSRPARSVQDAVQSPAPPHVGRLADTTALELDTLRDYFGPTLVKGMSLMGFGDIRSRADLERIVGMMRQAGL